MTMDNKPCPLSEEQIIEVAREAQRKPEGDWLAMDNASLARFARRLLSMAVPEGQMYYCNKCGFFGNQEVHEGCDYCAVPSAHSQAEPVAKTNGVVLINLGIDFAGREWVDLYDTAPPAPSSEAVKELVEALRNLRWAASERDKKNRIRQFDEIMDAADAALAKHGTQADTPEGCQCSTCKDGPKHWSDCAVHNEPAYPAGPCDCGTTAQSEGEEK
jgi:hypothetical protein